MGGLAQIRESAQRLLANREHTRGELIKKLAARDYPSADIEQILQLLEDEGLLSDTRAAETYIRQRVNKGYGELKIRAELQSKGVAASLLTACLAQAEVDWLAQAKRTFSKKFTDVAARHDVRLLAKQQRFLASRGFSSEVIRQVLRPAD